MPDAVAALQRAYRLHLESAKTAEAGLVACTLADIERTHLGAPAVAAGWLARARHHLRTSPDHPGHVLLEAMCAYRALAYEKDPAAARAFAQAALEHAQRVGDRRAEILALAYLGLVDVSLGRLVEGFARLDEATAAAMAGELEPTDVFDVHCLLISGCQRVRDVSRAQQWAERVLGLASREADNSFAAFARTQYAEVLIWRGDWHAAEQHLDAVLADTAGQPLTAAMAMVLRALLRRRQGRLDEALSELQVAEREPYRSAVRHMVLTARASIELDRGDAQSAADLAERYLRAVSVTDLIERVDALETLTRARIELGELDAATACAKELELAAEHVSTDGVRAAALLTRAAVEAARGELGDALRDLDDAVGLLDGAGLRHDAVLARLSLAAVHLGLARTEPARRCAEDARAGAVELGAAREVEAAGAILRRLREVLPGAGDLTHREVEVLRLVARGLSNADIAEQLVLSTRTVERHLSNIYLKIGATGSAARTIAVAHAHRVALVE